MLLLPTFTDPLYSITTNLDGVTFILDFKHNQRTDTWSFDLRDADGTMLAAGFKIVPEMLLLRKQAYRSDFPFGDIICLSLANDDDSPPGLLDLGPDGRCVLVYVEAADIIAG